MPIPLRRLGLIVAMGGTSALAQTTINPTHHRAYSPNSGWVDFRPSSLDGVSVGQFYCTGWAYDANTGWLRLGGGSAPANGHTWSNASATDYGVNHDGQGRLRGLAWSPNTGWVNFEDTGNPRVDLKTGNLSGHAYGANTGWISLSNSMARVKTDSLAPGPDSDGDGLPDAWEHARVGNLSHAAASNPDGDAADTFQEYLADTDPTLATAPFRITQFDWLPGLTPLVWNSRPTRCYDVERSSTPDSPGSFTLVPGLGDLAPGPGLTTAVNAPADLAERAYYRVRVKVPLTP
jgi:hypothetical protein